jgi:choline-sulfatase
MNCDKSDYAQIKAGKNMNTKHTRRSFLKALTATAAIGSIPGCLHSRATLGRAATSKRPNILLIITDDQAPHTLKDYGNTVCETPNIDRLAAEGVTFDSAYHMGSWSGAVCMPSRHMIMSGKTVWHLPDNMRNSRGRPIWSNPNARDTALVPPNLADFTMAAVFNRAGYDTFRTCKRGNSYDAANEHFTVRHDKIRRGATGETGSAWHADQALEYLKARQESKEKNPLLMFLGFSHPHDTRNGTPELLEKYGAYNAKKPPTQVNPKAPPLG